MYLFSDEVYFQLERPEKGLTNNVANIYSRWILLGVMSKAFGLGGLQIGWISTQIFI